MSALRMRLEGRVALLRRAEAAMGGRRRAIRPRFDAAHPPVPGFPLRAREAQRIDRRTDWSDAYLSAVTHPNCGMSQMQFAKPFARRRRTGGRWARRVRAKFEIRPLSHLASVDLPIGALRSLRGHPLRLTSQHSAINPSSTPSRTHAVSGARLTRRRARMAP